MRRRTTTLLALLAVLAPVLGACGGDETADPNGGTTTTPTQATTGPAPGDDGTTVPAPRESTVSVYLMRGEEIAVGEGRTVEGVEVARSALEALLEGPTPFEQEVGLTSAIPAGTELLDVALDDGVLTVELSEAFEAGGGSLSMQARLAQIVYTATQFDTVDAVRLRIEGEDVEALGGEGLVLDGPVERADFEFQGPFERLAPSILLESPRLGETVEAPLRITGSANVFEATFQVEVVDGSGRIVTETFVTATAGTGTRGTFDATLEVADARAGMGAVVTFVLSARDGSRQDVTEVPVRFG